MMKNIVVKLESEKGSIHVEEKDGHYRVFSETSEGTEVSSMYKSLSEAMLFVSMTILKNVEQGVYESKNDDLAGLR